MTATDPAQAAAQVMRTHLWSHAAQSCSCGWERKGKAPFLRQWTKHLAEVVMAAARPLIAAEALREAAEELEQQGVEPWDRNSVAIRTLRFRADQIEAD